LGEFATGTALGGEEVSAAGGEVIKRGVEKPTFLLPVQHLRGAFPHVGILAPIEQEVAVAESPARVELRILRLPALLHEIARLEPGCGATISVKTGTSATAAPAPMATSARGKSARTPGP
jgi:hypothetical protein